jgi:hypothetical protein
MDIGNCRETILNQQDVGCRASDICAERHHDSNIRDGQRWSIIDSITQIGDVTAIALQPFYSLLLWLKFGKDLIDTSCSGQRSRPLLTIPVSMTERIPDCEPSQLNLRAIRPGPRLCQPAM